MRPSKGVFDVALSLVCQFNCHLFGKGQMSLSLFHYNTNVAIILNLCDAVSNFYNLLLIVGIKSSTKGRFKSCAIVVWNSADQISISANELRFLKQQGHQA